MNGDDLIFNGEIVLEGDVMPHEWCYWPDDGCFSARMLREALATFDGAVTVRVNSPGGHPFEGEACRAALEAHGGHVTAIVAGQASSAASLLIMGADEIQMTAGSFIMIHDPSNCLCGNADELRQAAEYLDTLSDTYAAVYAAQASLSVDEVRQLMRDETWLGPQAAIDAGFANSIIEVTASGTGAEGSPALQVAMAAHATTVSTLRMCVAKANAQPDDPATQEAGRSGQITAMSATTMETEMPPEVQTNTQEAPPVTGAAPVSVAATSVAASGAATEMRADDTQASEQRGAEAERTRQREIRALASPFMTSGQLTAQQVDAVIDAGVPIEQASQRLMTSMAGAQPVTGTAPSAVPAQARRDGRDPAFEGMINALMRNFDGPGAEFRGMRMRGLAMHLAGSARGYSDPETIRRGMMSTSMSGGAHGVSDFAYITTEVMNRTLLGEYERRSDQWRLVTGEPMTASDFREIHAVRFGGDFQLKDVLENGEYKEAVLADQAEGLVVKRKGRTLSITFEAVVSDDMGVFNRIPREFAMAARMMESSMVWALVRDNAVLKSDSKALFHSDHKNLNAGTAGVINVARVAAARKNMWEQRAFGSKDTDDFMDLTPDLLIVPPALELAAGQFVRPTTPSTDSEGNPYKSTLTPHTVPNVGAAAGGSDTAWYLLSSDMPPISVAYLDGYEAPTVQTIEGMNPDKVTMNARHIFGAAPSEYRGAQKNNGA